jgi:tRNA nucleotidyltransferase (CCA-adding enzyme)
MCGPILKELRFDNKSMREIGLLVKYHDYHLGKKVDKILIKKIMRYTGEALFDKLLEVQLADARAQALDKLLPKEKEIQQVKELKNEIMINKECYDLKDLAITGKDLIEHHLAKGKEIGERLEELLSFVLKNPEKNEKHILLEKLKKSNEKT